MVTNGALLIEEGRRSLIEGFKGALERVRHYFRAPPMPKDILNTPQIRAYLRHTAPDYHAPDLDDGTRERMLEQELLEIDRRVWTQPRLPQPSYEIYPIADEQPGNYTLFKQIDEAA